MLYDNICVELSMNLKSLQINLVITWISQGVNLMSFRKYLGHIQVKVYINFIWLPTYL